MITIRHAVNQHLEIEPSTAVEQVAGLDLARAAERVRAEGGDVTIFTAAVGRALRATAQLDREGALSIAACAAWRAGVVDIRADALRRAHTAPAPAVAAALLLPAAELPAFLAAQARDPFGWGGVLVGWIAVVGGFRGLGGQWIEPPTAFGASSEPGEFWVIADGEKWLLRADIFGHRWLPWGERPQQQGESRLRRLAEHSYLLGIEQAPWIRS